MGWGNRGLWDGMGWDGMGKGRGTWGVADTSGNSMELIGYVYHVVYKGNCYQIYIS